MSSTPSFKELVKAVHDSSEAGTYPLPDDLVQILDNFLFKHEDKVDESVSDKLHDELLSIWNKDVLPVPARYATFVAILRRLRPLISEPAKVLQWFEILLPVLDHLNQQKGLVKEATEVMLDILITDHGDIPNTSGGGVASPLAEKLLLLWLKGCEVHQKHGDPYEEFKARQFRNTLISYGKKRPKDFMTLIDQYVCKKVHRSLAILLLSHFVQSQPPHLYLILQTPLFANLLKCLQWDTSTTTISLALSALTMILPHVPSSLVPHLPTLFNIYARLLFWGRELSVHAATGANTKRRMSSSAPAWETCLYSPDVDDTNIPQLMAYFTVLYGLYPINFMDYIRKPQRYLRHAELPNTDDVEVQPTEIRHASEHFRQCHLLHENFYTLTIDTEKTDFGRWIKSEPAEVVANCMALCQVSDTNPSAHHVNSVHAAIPERDDINKDERESALLSSSASIGAPTFGSPPEINQESILALTGLAASNRPQSNMVRHPSQSSQQSSTKRSGNEVESPLLSRVVSSGSQTQLQDLIDSNKVVKSDLHQSLRNDSVPSLALSHPGSISERTASQLHSTLPAGNTPLHSVDSETPNTQLVRFIFLLYNDLVFERFMKQQHLTHIGELRRRHVREAASEAETQDLIIANRHLKQRLEEAKKSELRAKAEADKSRTLAKKWEADLSIKLKTLKEEQRKWNLEGSSLRTDLAAAKNEAENLVKLVCEAEVRELGWTQNLQSVEINVNELERLKRDVEGLTESERNHQARESEFQMAKVHAAEADSRVAMLDMKLKARDTEFQLTSDALKSQIAVLNKKLQDSLANGAQRNTETLKAQLNDAWSSSRATQRELTRRVEALTKKNTALQALVLDLQSANPRRSLSETRPAVEAVVDQSSDSESHWGGKNRRHRGLSDSELFEATSFNMTPPLEPVSLSKSVSMQAVRPSTPSGAEGVSVGKGSPTAPERYFGRGGVQNLRKDKKDKKDDKDRKKSTGLRGIRGFV
ncbi:hypothetical protein GGR56DRAFT_632497 [Xylariaceae sp. FL0804]|nr:hypothetical protein GGR56DRAFT_632497 [Xylariaceae sp. FL0804]